MLFRKLKVDAGGNGVTEMWSLFLRTPEDVFKYMKIDSELAFQSYLTLEKSKQLSHITGSRQIVIDYALQAAAMRAQPGENVYALDIISKIWGDKTGVMLRIVMSGDMVKVNERGGYCDWKSFSKTWEDRIEILEEIEKDSIYFPTDQEALKFDYLILENNEMAAEFNVEMRRNYGWEWKNKRVITLLKQRDPKWVFESIMNAKEIAMETQAVDHIQVDQFMKMFLKVPRKKIYIKTSNPDDIRGHELFEQNNQLHEIIFL